MRLSLRNRLLLCILLPLAAAALAAGPAASQQKGAPDDLVLTQTGELPLILSAPHGGLRAIPGAPVRKGEGLPKGSKGFFTGRDTGTEELALEVAAAVENRFGKKPHYVIARFHRKYVDANRPAAIAYEHAKAKPVYDAYHAALERACREVQKTYGRGLLLDIHGQGSARDTVFRGTQNGKTVTLLVQRYGAKAHNGPESLFGLLAARGWKVHPQGEGKEQAGFTGGYIVQTYGSHQGYGIDAIQLEFGGDYRAKDSRKDTAARLADAVAAYAKRYLPDAPAVKRKAG
jgi:N-formylglutamate amidohydrolase